MRRLSLRGRAVAGPVLFPRPLLLSGIPSFVRLRFLLLVRRIPAGRRIPPGRGRGEELRTDPEKVPSFLRVFQELVGEIHPLKILGALSRIPVRVGFHGSFAKGCLDFFVRGTGADAENRIVVYKLAIEKIGGTGAVVERIGAGTEQGP